MRIDISMLVNVDPISYKTGGRAIKEKIGEAIDALFTERARDKHYDHFVIAGSDPKGLGREVRGVGLKPDEDRKIGSVRLVRTHCVPW